MVPVLNRKNIKLYIPLKRLKYGVMTISYPPIKQLCPYPTRLLVIPFAIILVVGVY